MVLDEHLCKFMCVNTKNLHDIGTTNFHPCLYSPIKSIIISDATKVLKVLNTFRWTGLKLVGGWQIKSATFDDTAYLL